MITTLHRVWISQSRYASRIYTYERHHAGVELAVLCKTLTRVRPEGRGGEKGRVRKLELAQRNLVIGLNHCYTGKQV